MGKNQRPVFPGPRLGPDNPPTAPFEHKDSDCGKDCGICFPQYFPSQCSVSNEDAQKATRILANSIKNDYAHLRRILENNADDIAHRWKNMSQTKRGRLLQENGDLFDCHPALVHLTNTNMKLGDDRIFRRKAREMAGPDCSEEKSEFLMRYLWQTMTPVLLEASKADFLDTWSLPYLDLESLTSHYPFSVFSTAELNTHHINGPYSTR